MDFGLMEDEGWINYNFTHDACTKGLSANDIELKGNQLLAGLSGFNKEKGLEMVYKWCFYCLIKYCVFSEHWLKEPLPFISNGKQYILYGTG